MEEIKGYIQKAKDYVYGSGDGSSMQAMTTVLSRIKEDVKNVASDRMLSAIGIAEKEREIREGGAKELAQIVTNYRKLVDAELDAAERKAHAILDKQTDKPDQRVLDAFTDTYQDALTRLTVFNTPQSAHTLLHQMQTVTDPHIAKTLRDDFAKFGASMKQHVDTFALQSAYERISKVAETDAKSIAKQTLQEISNLRKASPVNSMIGIGIESVLGSQYRSVVNDPNSFLN